MSTLYTDVPFLGRKQLTTIIQPSSSENVLAILKQVFPDHLQNAAQIDYLWKYYLGNQPILERVKTVRPDINNKIVENHANEIVQFFASYVFGEGCQYVKRGKSLEQSNETMDDIARLNQYLASSDKTTQDKELANWFLATGVAYRIVLPKPFADVGEIPVYMGVLDPRNTFVVYNAGFTHEPLMAVTYTLLKDGIQQYYQYGIYTNTMYYELQTTYAPLDFSMTTMRSSASNYLGMLPIIEYNPNGEKTSSFENVLSLMEAINNVTSNRIDGVEQFVQAIMKFKNCDITEDDFLNLSQLGALKIKGEPGLDVDAELMTAELDQTQVQTMIDYLYQTMLTISGVPDRRTAGNGSTGLATLTSNGWHDTEAKSKSIELFFTRSEKQFIKLLLRILRDIQTEYDFSQTHVSDIEIKFNRNKLDNFVAKTQGLLNLLNAGISPRVAIGTVGLFADSENVYQESKDLMGKWNTVAPKVDTTSNLSM